MQVGVQLRWYLAQTAHEHVPDFAPRHGDLFLGSKADTKEATRPGLTLRRRETDLAERHVRVVLEPITKCIVGTQQRQQAIGHGWVNGEMRGLAIAGRAELRASTASCVAIPR